jgi:hypothetical protein
MFPRLLQPQTLTGMKFLLLIMNPLSNTFRQLHGDSPILAQFPPTLYCRLPELGQNLERHQALLLRVRG